MKPVHKAALLAAIPFLLFAGLGAAFYAAIYAGDPHILPSALIGKTVPAFELGPIEGETIPGLSSRDLAQGKMTVLNVFASWCIPCRSEHPMLKFLGDENVQNTFQLVAINYKDGAAQARAFLSEFSNPFARIGADASGRTAIDFGVYGVPETYLIDGKGKITFKHVGPLTPEVVADEILPRLKGEK